MIAAGFVTVFSLLSWITQEPVFSQAERHIIATLSPLPSVPEDPTNRAADDPVAARLGEALFFDRRLSASGQNACASCHVPALGFADGKPLASAAGQLTRHTPSLWNVAWQSWMFWDGRADSLWAQALRPIEHPDELASTRVAAIHLLHVDDAYRADYESAFGPLPDANNTANIDQAFANIGKALAAFQRRLISTPTRFDHFAAALANDNDLEQNLSIEEQRGLKLFIGKGRCVFCHSGPTFSDGQFHATAIPDRLIDAGRIDGIEIVAADPFNAAGPFSDDPQGQLAQRLKYLASTFPEHGQFKTPGLRNVADSPPYMHGGQLATLQEVVEHYSSLHQAPSHGHSGLLQPLGLSTQEKKDLVAFLKSLSSAPQDPWLRKLLARSAEH